MSLRRFRQEEEADDEGEKRSEEADSSDDEHAGHAAGDFVGALTSGLV